MWIQWGLCWKIARNEDDAQFSNKGMGNTKIELHELGRQYKDGTYSLQQFKQNLYTFKKLLSINDVLIITCQKLSKMLN